MRLPKSIVAAAALLVLATGAGSYVDLRSDAMHAHHLAITTSLERMTRLNEELGSMLMISVLARSTLRSASYDSVRADLEQTVANVERLTAGMALADEITALEEQRRELRRVESEAVRSMRADQWPQALAALSDDRYVRARKIHEIDSATAIGALTGELAASAQRFSRVRTMSLAARLGTLALLLWAGFAFSRRQRLEMAEQARLREAIGAANRQLEAKVRSRTAELEAANRKLEALSGTDGLTGLANRRRFDEIWAAEWQRAARHQLALAIVMIDVDGFKAYNDDHGHQAGDDCLRRVARVLAATAQRSGELAARYGGEEFVAVLPGADDEQARELAERIRLAVQAEAIVHVRAPHAGVVTVSAGVASAVPQPGATPQALIEAADAALYEAKRHGRNTVVAAGAAARTVPASSCACAPQPQLAQLG
jgi:diguanylate cyclase (GGDEF)-like protein